MIGGAGNESPIVFETVCLFGNDERSFTSRVSCYVQGGAGAISIRRDDADTDLVRGVRCQRADRRAAFFRKLVLSLV